MPCFETRIENNQLLCGCMIANPDATNSEILRQYTALIDTGATKCAISKKVVQELHLTSNQTAPLIGVHGPQETKIYRVDIGLFTTSPAQMKSFANTEEQHDTIVEAKMGQKMSVFELDNTGQSYDAIIGMDYLSICTLVVSNNKFTLCY